MGCGGSKDDKGGADGGSSTTAATGNVSHDETKALFNLVSKGNPNIYKTQVEEWYERVHPSKDNKEKDALRERVASTFMVAEAMVCVLNLAAGYDRGSQRQQRGSGALEGVDGRAQEGEGRGRVQKVVQRAQSLVYTA